MHPRLSLIVPTRQRPRELAQFLDSVTGTVADPRAVELVLVVDADDPTSAVSHRQLQLVHAVGSPGRTMGQLNQAGFLASSGDYVMLLNDDVIVRTSGWDEKLLSVVSQYPDGIVLAHVNDTLMGEHLCTFPLVSRIYCQLAGGICPVDYHRYRIDDHIQEVFQLLALVGESRTVYLPEIEFEHTNAVEVEPGVREYHAEASILAVDVPIFERLFAQRKQLALRLLRHIEEHRLTERLRSYEERILNIDDPKTLQKPIPARYLPALARLLRCYRRGGLRGVAEAALKRLPLPSSRGVHP